MAVTRHPRQHGKMLNFSLTMYEGVFNARKLNRACVIAMTLHDKSKGRRLKKRRKQKITFGKMMSIQDIHNGPKWVKNLKCWDVPIS